jgi:hypothetical protein
MSTYDVVKFAHIGFGTIALLSFWISAATRKGSAPHKASGKVFLLAMVAVLALSVPMAWTIWFKFSRTLGAFLAYLIVLVSAGVWRAWRAVRDRRDFRRYVGPVYRTLALSNLAAGLGVFALGSSVGSPLFAGFSLIGVASGVAMLRFARAEPSDPRWWLSEHLSAMLGNGVATHIAFLSIGLPRLVPVLDTPAWTYTAWFGPVAMLYVAQYFLRRKYLPSRPAPDQSQPQSQRSSRTKIDPASSLSGNLAVGS